MPLVLLLGDQGHDNNAFGNSTLEANTFGQGNTAVGESALRNNVSGNENVALGMNSLLNNTGSSNVAVGFGTLRDNSTGTSNTAIGYNANATETTSNGTTAVGANSVASEFFIHRGWVWCTSGAFSGNGYRGGGSDDATESNGPRNDGQYVLASRCRVGSKSIGAIRTDAVRHGRCQWKSVDRWRSDKDCYR